MTDGPLLLILAAGLLLFGIFSRRIEQYSVTPPMLFLVLGAISGPLLFNWSSPAIDSGALKTIAELTLALILFTDASQVNRSHLVKFENLPIRLLAIGLPLTIAAGALGAHLLFPTGWEIAILIGIILAPTDAALAQSIFSEMRLSERLRHSITVESGLNDGLALPFLLLALALITATDMSAVDPLFWGNFVFVQIFAGAIIGLASGYTGGTLIEWAGRRDWMDPVFQRLASLALALMTYALAEQFGGNGFVAVFIAGLFLQAQQKIIVQRLKEFGEAEGQLLSLVMFFLFGMIYIPDAIGGITPAVVTYALLSLTLIRILPVWLALAGTGLNLREKLFMGWFGPRGIASILYLLLVIDELGFKEQIPGYETLFPTVVITVTLSVFLHGLSVPFWVKLLRRRESC